MQHSKSLTTRICVNDVYVSLHPSKYWPILLLRTRIVRQKRADNILALFSVLCACSVDFYNYCALCCVVRDSPGRYTRYYSCRMNDKTAHFLYLWIGKLAMRTAREIVIHYDDTPIAILAQAHLIRSFWTNLKRQPAVTEPLKRPACIRASYRDTQA